MRANFFAVIFGCFGFLLGFAACYVCFQRNVSGPAALSSAIENQAAFERPADHTDPAKTEKIEEFPSVRVRTIRPVLRGPSYPVTLVHPTIPPRAFGGWDAFEVTFGDLRRTNN